MIVALTGQKGGVGKSTLAICIAAELLARRHKVLLVDADPQGTARTWAEVAAELGQPLPSVVSMGATMHRPEQLPTVGQGYDDVVIDCPPRHGDIQRSALMVADVALLPCGPSSADAWALAASIDLINEARSLRPELEVRIVITRKQGRTALGRSAREELTKSGIDLMKTEIGYRVAFAESLGAGLGVTAYAPRDAAASETRALVSELLLWERRLAAPEAPGPKAARR
ncbi:MAG: AAA family ATPase [Deltaproteobacteria bacterium]|nr:AAA family ATPase [Deltaproteobacteria bacterium]